MYKNKKVAVVVPAHNESRHIADVLNAIPAFVDYVVAVDDCSRDETLSLMQALQNERIVALQTPSNLGVGGATMLGYSRALELQCDIAVKMDGDGQMSPAHL